MAQIIAQSSILKQADKRREVQAAEHAQNVWMAQNDAELKDLKSQRPYFVRRLESATEQTKNMRRYDLYMLDKRIATKQKQIDSYLKRINSTR